jgi:hypothetical protein
MFRANQHNRRPRRSRGECGCTDAGDDSAQEREPKCWRDHCSEVRNHKYDAAAEQQTLPRYGRGQCGYRRRQESEGYGINRCHLPGSTTTDAECARYPGQHASNHETVGAKREHS